MLTASAQRPGPKDLRKTLTVAPKLLLRVESVGGVKS